MKTETVLSKTVIVPAHKLHIYREYIEKQVRELEGKNYSNEVGFIYRVLEMTNIENYAIIKNDFSGSIVYKATFLVENCNPEVGNTVDCSIVQNSNITLASNSPLKIIIINEPGLPKLEKDDKVTVEILCKEINHGAEYIKVVGRFLSKLN